MKLCVIEESSNHFICFDVEACRQGIVTIGEGNSPQAAVGDALINMLRQGSAVKVDSVSLPGDVSERVAITQLLDWVDYHGELSPNEIPSQIFIQLRRAVGRPIPEGEPDAVSMGTS